MAQRTTPPKYQRIADELRARIESGEYPPGSMLPSKAALIGHYHVALNTIDRAVEVLRKQGFAEPVQGVGTFARQPPPSALSSGDATAKRLDDLESAVGELREALIGIRREGQDHARLLARMSRGLEGAGITLDDADQQDAQAM